MSEELDRLALADVRRRAARTARRTAPWVGIALVLLLISIPAEFDLRTLLIALACVTLGLGGVTALFTWFDRNAH